MEMDFEPRREASSVQVRSCAHCQKICHLIDEIDTCHFYDLLPDDVFHDARGFDGRFASLARDVHHLLGDHC